MPRYPEEPPYSRPSREAPRRDERDIRRNVDPAPRDRRPERERERERDRERDFRVEDTMDTRVDTRMDNRMDTRMDTRVDNRMETMINAPGYSPMDSRMDPRMETRVPATRPDNRGEPRANTGRQVREGREVMYRDMETGVLYQDPVLGTRRAAYADDFDDLSPATRPIISSPPTSGETYNEYFVPADGIDREVIQREICRYLGSDALCRPGKSTTDGRPGYWVKAYRALTSEMIKSLQDSSSRLWAERDKRRRTGRGGEVPYAELQDNRDYVYHDVSMDMDMDDRLSSMNARVGREVDPRLDPRAQPPPRIGGLPPTTSGFMVDSGYPPGFAISHGPNPQHGMQYEPRTYNTGNTPPPQAGGMRTNVGGLPPAGFPTRSMPSSMPTMTAPVYRDPNADRMREYAYPQDRHRR